MTNYDDLHAVITRLIQEGEDGLGEDWLVSDYIVVAVSQSMKPGEEGFTGMSYFRPPGQPSYRAMGLLTHALRKYEHDITEYEDD